MLDDPSKLSGLPRRSSEVRVVAAVGWLDIGSGGKVDGNQKVMIGVGLQDEDFG